jgi:hypothetical protein
MTRQKQARTAVALGVLATVACALDSVVQAAPSDWRELVRSLRGPRDGDVMVDHQPHNTGGPGSDTAYDILGIPLWQRSADNFALGTSAFISGVRWWGFYGSTFDDYPEPPPSSESMRIRFYADQPAHHVPDEANILYEETFANPLRLPTGRMILTGSSPPEYMFHAPLSSPVWLTADVHYWLEIVQLENPDSYFRWEYSITQQDGFLFVNQDVQEWDVYPGADTAYQLMTVPEPASLVLLTSASLVAARTRGGKEA